MAGRAALRIWPMLPVLAGLAASNAHALSIELKDVAADRVERQRAAAAGALPLPGTPNVAILDERLREKGVTLAAPILIRVFKAESELEIWKKKGGSFVLFATYPICHWSGSLGPKQRSGDKQAPEGFYTVNRQQTRHVGRWPKSINIGFPNVLDVSLARTGSDILIHGGCTSVGCFAMTNPVMDEIHQLTTAAMDAGQDLVQIHILPFRMTPQKVAEHAQSPWMDVWSNLKQGYDAFERSRRPLGLSICEGRYEFRELADDAYAGPIEACPPTLTAIKDQEQWLRHVPPPPRPNEIAVAPVAAPGPSPALAAQAADAPDVMEIPRPRVPAALAGAIAAPASATPARAADAGTDEAHQPAPVAVTVEARKPVVVSPAQAADAPPPPMFSWPLVR